MIDDKTFASLPTNIIQVFAAQIASMRNPDQPIASVDGLDNSLRAILAYLDYRYCQEHNLSNDDLMEITKRKIDMYAKEGT